MKYTTHLLRHTAQKCPQRIKDTPAVLFYRIPCICIVYFKRLTANGISEPPWTAVVSSRSQFVNANWQPKNEQGCSFLGVPAVLFYRIPCICIVYFKRLTANGISEPPRMAVVLRSSVFVSQTRSPKMYRTYIFGRASALFLFAPCIRYHYFQKRWKCVYYCVAAPRIYAVYFQKAFQNGQGCPWFHAVATFLPSKNSRSKIDKEVNF
ncbi:hypothetical protein [Treponema sp. OMZ 855]|uniref:hypothetical protein n=1 Tax=Treponema sp. OMZ 855 TaxID=1643512 RepID=UPI0020A48ADC|nr:hypothetical protein [Treponema sp. OMZ 855]